MGWVGPADEASREGSTQNRNGWRRPLFVVTVASFLLVAAYCLSYVWWARDMMRPGGSHMSKTGYAISTPCEPGWEVTLDYFVDTLWAPLRALDERRDRVRHASHFNGAWVAEDGRLKLFVKLGSNGKGQVRCEGFPQPLMEGRWSWDENERESVNRHAMVHTPDKGGVAMFLHEGVLYIVLSEPVADEGAKRGPEKGPFADPLDGLNEETESRFIAKFRRLNGKEAAEAWMRPEEESVPEDPLTHTGNEESG